MDGESLALVAAVATAAATLTSALLSILWRWLDRAEADWGLIESGSGWEEVERYNIRTPPHAWARISNLGDGSAYRVTFSQEGGSNAYVAPAGVDRAILGPVPIARTGDMFYVKVNCAPDAWDGARLVIEWSAPPTWKRRRLLGLRSARRRQAIPLSDFGPPPTLDTGSKYPD